MKTVKISLIVVGLVALGYWLLDVWFKAEYRELTYGVNQIGAYEWHQKELGVQKSVEPDEYGLRLRKVNIEDRNIIIARKTDDYSLGPLMVFVAECEPGSEIETDKIYAGGEPIKLVCAKNGKSLQAAVGYAPEDVPLVKEFEFEYGGFNLKEDLSKWDFSILDREITLKKAEEAKAE